MPCRACLVFSPALPATALAGKAGQAGSEGASVRLVVVGGHETHLLGDTSSPPPASASHTSSFVLLSALWLSCSQAQLHPHTQNAYEQL